VANITIELSEDIYAELTGEPSGPSATEGESLALLLDLILFANYQITQELNTELPWSIFAGHSHGVRLDFVDGGYLAYEYFAPVFGANNLATAHGLDANFPQNFRLKYDGGVDLSYFPSGEYAHIYPRQMRIETAYLETLLPPDEADPDLGNVQIGLSGNIIIAENGAMSGVVTELTTHIQHYGSAIYRGQLSVTGDAHAIGAGFAESSLSGYIDYANEYYRDGSRVEFDGQGSSLPLDHDDSVGLGILSNPDLFPGDDIFHILLPDNLPNLPAIASGDGDDLVNLRGASTGMIIDGGKGNDRIELWSSGSYTALGGDGVDTLFLAYSQDDFDTRYDEATNTFTLRHRISPDYVVTGIDVEYVTFGGWSAYVGTTISPSSSESDSEFQLTKPFAYDSGRTDIVVAARNGNGLPATRILDFAQEGLRRESPSHIDFPLAPAVIRLEVDNPGDTANISIYIDDSLGIDGYWMTHWYDWVNLASSITQVEGKTRLDISVTDQGFLDQSNVEGMILINFSLGAGARPTLTMEDRILALYIAYFHRAPDENGMAFWLEQHGHGQSLDDISAGFANHPRFEQEYGGLSNRQIAEKLYQNVLRREGDANGITYWTDRLAQEPVSDVVVEFTIGALEVDLTDMYRRGELSAEEYSVAFERQHILENQMLASRHFLEIFGSRTIPQGPSETVAETPAYLAAVAVLEFIDSDPNYVYNQYAQLLGIQYQGIEAVFDLLSLA